MIKLIAYILENWTTYVLGYIPALFPESPEQFYGLSIFVLSYLGLFIVIQLIHFIYTFIVEYTYKEYIYISLAYIVFNTFISFLIFFIAFNIFGATVSIVACIFWMALCFITEILDDLEKMDGVLKIMRLSKDYSKVLKEYSDKKEEWKRQYNELLNF